MEHDDTPEVFTITPGDPWRINGEVTDARSPQDALRQILEDAEHFPVRVQVHTHKRVFALDMDERGRTTPVPDEDPEPVVAASEDNTEQDEAPREDVQESARSRKLPVWQVAVPALGLLLVGIGAAWALSGGGEQPAASTPSGPETSASPVSGWRIPETQQPVAVLDKYVVTLEKNDLRIFDAASGARLGKDYRVEDPAKVRYLEGSSASAVDTGTGQVIRLAGSDPQVIAGVLNARGTEPVIVREREYIRADGSKHSLRENQGVLAGTAKQVVLAENPNKIFMGKKSVELKAPQTGATLSQWIGATDSHVVTVWSKGAESWLTGHKTSTGAPTFSEKIGGSKISVRSGVIWVGQNRYLQGDQIKQMCSGGEQINSTIMCPGADGWESSDHRQKFPDAPTAASTSYAVIDGTVTTLRKDQ